MNNKIIQSLPFFMGKPFWWKRGAQLLQRKVAGWTLGGLKVSEGLDDKVWIPQNFHETLIWLVVFRHPSEKWWSESQLGWWHSQYVYIYIWKNKIYVLNHQPANRSDFRIDESAARNGECWMWNFGRPLPRQGWEIPDRWCCECEHHLPSGYVKIAIENGPFIVDLPIKDGDFL